MLELTSLSTIINDYNKCVFTERLTFNGGDYRVDCCAMMKGGSQPEYLYITKIVSHVDLTKWYLIGNYVEIISFSEKWFAFEIRRKAAYSIVQLPEHSYCYNVFIREKVHNKATHVINNS